MTTKGLLVERKYGKIYEDRPWNRYEIKHPKLGDKEKELVKLVNQTALQHYSIGDLQVLYLTNKEKGKFIEKLTYLLDKIEPYSKTSLSAVEEKKALELVKDFIKGVAPTTQHTNELAQILLRDLVGLGKISFLLEDDELEEVMVNGARKPVFVFDRKYGFCRTSMIFDKAEEIKSLISRIAYYVNKEISDDKPLLDARLPDGSRVNATIQPASPKSPTITIRKFRRVPLTITDIIENKTLSVDLTAFLWLCVEGMQVSPMNIVISGGTGSGKTTTLNALSVFIPKRERIVTIEDTLELNLYERENWIQLESRPAIYEAPISIDDLLKNSIRMRPDRIIVGEVRGAEAETMFTAMDIGHEGLLSTLHANSARETLLRLQSRPMNVPTAMFTLLDLVIMQHRMYSPNKGLIRRVSQVAEVSVMGEHVLLNDLYSMDHKTFETNRTELPSHVLEKLSFLTGLKINELKEELSLRELVLAHLVKNKIKDYLTIQKIISEYYENPVKLLKKIGAKV